MLSTTLVISLATFWLRLLLSLKSQLQVLIRQRYRPTRGDITLFEKHWPTKASCLDFATERYKGAENNERRKLINEITKDLITPISHSTRRRAIISERNGREDLRGSPGNFRYNTKWPALVMSQFAW